MKLSVCLLLCTLSSSYALSTGVDIMGEYIDLSLKLLKLLNGTNVDEKQIIEVSKNVIHCENVFNCQIKEYNGFVESLNEDQKKKMEDFVEDISLHHVEERIQKVLASYLTKDHIKRIKKVIREQIDLDSCQEEIHICKVMELAKDIGDKKPTLNQFTVLKQLPPRNNEKKKKAMNALEKVERDLNILKKKHGGLIEKLNDLFIRSMTIRKCEKKAEKK